MLPNLNAALETHQGEILEHGIKDVAYKLNKAEPTYYAELRHAKGYKLGVIEFFKGIDETGKDKALRRILCDLGKACYNMPKIEGKNIDTHQLVADLSQEAVETCGEYFSKSIKALADGKVDKKEAQTIKNRAQKAVSVMAQAMAVCDLIVNK